jgi:hypothetical protein
VGADRNTVSDVSMDVRYPEGIDTQYSNAHAGLWDGMMAGVGLRDVFREVEGPQAKQYTRLGSSVHTRIDCLFAPCNSQELQWYTVTAVRLSNASWTSDHLALIAQAGQVPDKPDIGKGPKRINPDIFLDDTLACPAIRTLYREIDTKYPKGQYGCKPTWSKKLASVAHLMQGQSADHAKSAQIDKYLELTLNRKVTQAQANDPSPQFAAVLRKIDKEKRRARKRKPCDPHSNLRRTHFEEMSTKEFYSKFKAKHTKRYISELYEVDSQGQVRTQHNTVHSPGGMLQALTTYYEMLMSDKGMDPIAAEKLFAKLRERKLSAVDRDRIEGVITVEEVLEAIANLASRKSPGPDGVPPEFYRRFATMLAPDLADMYNECHDDGQLTPSMMLGEIILLYKKKGPERRPQLPAHHVA